MTDGVDVADRSPRSGALFVGRERELGELRAALDAAFESRGGLVLIAGEAGIGKTRLVEELARYAAQHDARALWAHCWAGEGSPAFWPWTQLIRAYADGLERSVLRAQLGDALDDVALLVPELRNGEPGARISERGPEQARFALLNGVATLFRRAAVTQTLLLVIEDLHWADLASLELLRFLVRELSSSRQLLVATFREGDAAGEQPLARVLGEISTDSQRVSLAGLEIEAVAQLVSAMRPLLSTSDALVADVNHRTAGNPFFVREVTRLLDADTRVQPGEPTSRAVGVPAGVRELLMARCERLPASTRSVLEAASVIGTQFAPELLEALCPHIQPSPGGGVVTVLFTDVVGSTELLARLGDDAAEGLRRTHFGLLRNAAAAHGGREIKSLGDGLEVVFESVLDALSCAGAMQRAVRAEIDQQVGQPLSMRIGLSVGEPTPDEDEFFGTPVVVARRLCDRAAGGQILASHLVRSLVGTRGGHHFRELGPMRLKGLPEPVSVCELLGEEGLERSAPEPAPSGPSQALGAVERPEPSRTVQDALGHAVAARILRAAERAAGRYEFVHALFQETIYDTLDGPRRAELHRVAAQTIERLHAADLRPHLGELAEHYRRALSAGTIEQAIDYSLRAGEAARAVFAWEEVARQLQAALGLIEDRGGDPAELAHLLGMLGNLMYVSGLDSAAGIEYLERAVAIYDEIGEDEQAGQMRFRLGRSLTTYPDAHMDVARGIAHLQAADALIGERQSTEWRAALFTSLANACRFGLRIEEGAAGAARAVALAEQTTDVATRSIADAVQGRYLGDSGRVDEGMALIGQAWEAADRVNHETAAFLVTWIAGSVSCFLFAPLPAQAWCERELAKPRTAQAPVQRDHLFTFLAQAHALMGGIAKARELAEEVASIRWFEPVHMWGQDEHRALAQWSDSLALTQRTGDNWMGSRTRYWLGRLQRIRGEHQAAEVHLRAGLALALAHALSELSFRGELALLCLEVGDIDEAQEHARRAVELLAAGGDWHGLGGRAQLAAAAVSAAEAGEPPVTFAAAIKTFRRCRLPWDEAEALQLWGRSLLAAGAAAQGREKLEGALELYQRHGAAPHWTKRLQKELDGAGRPAAAGDRVPSGVANTMTRQGDYWTIVFEGHTTRLRSSKGLEHLAVLLARPGEELHVLELAAATGAAHTPSPAANTPELRRERGDAGELLDARAKTAYRERITELEGEAEEAEGFNDPERAVKARAELDSLTRELARAVGLGGRDRRAASASERARVRITLALRTAAKRIEKADPGLARHLHDALRTGNYCSYRPDRRAAIPWRVDVAQH
jgi:class 3 adenylate cyclase/tetratricopeptide (TPR) repeat protein